MDSWSQTRFKKNDQALEQEMSFLHCQSLTINGTLGEGRGPSLFFSTTSTHSIAFRHLFATFHVGLLPRILSGDLPPWRLTIYLIDAGMSILYLFT